MPKLKAVPGSFTGRYRKPIAKLARCNMGIAQLESALDELDDMRAMLVEELGKCRVQLALLAQQWEERT